MSSEDDHGGFECDTKAPCMECGVPTNRVDICFEAHLHYECAPAADRKYWMAVGLPEGFHLSGDGRTLTWGLPCSIGGQPATRNGSVSWDHDPTPDEFNYAVENATTLDDMAREVGQGSKIRRLRGNWFVYHTWGPPVWWLPRPVFSIRKREIGFGWLTHGFILGQGKGQSK